MLNKTQKGALARLNGQLVTAGVDPESVRALAVDYVHAEARIAELRGRERRARDKAKAAATRSLNVALAEQRRLQALFKRPSNPGPEPLTDAERRKARKQLAADEAWRGFLHRRDRSVSEAELLRKHGEAGWAALVHKTVEDWAETLLICEADCRRTRSPYVRDLAVLVWLEDHPGFAESVKFPIVVDTPTNKKRPRLFSFQPFHDGRRLRDV